ncbi:MAG: hypothetical protein B7Z37_26480 [Verrucomicrobia bacterium 12-59-8]|nr:MAG: hypothetical protein B7Z37_26480 [Verrucomicrobia bacterium 12-59-8]
MGFLLFFTSLSFGARCALREEEQEEEEDWREARARTGLLGRDETVAWLPCPAASNEEDDATGDLKRRGGRSRCAEMQRELQGMGGGAAVHENGIERREFGEEERDESGSGGAGERCGGGGGGDFERCVALGVLVLLLTFFGVVVVMLGGFVSVGGGAGDEAGAEAMAVLGGGEYGGVLSLMMALVTALQAEDLRTRDQQYCQRGECAGEGRRHDEEECECMSRRGESKGDFGAVLCAGAAHISWLSSPQGRRTFFSACDATDPRSGTRRSGSLPSAQDALGPQRAWAGRDALCDYRQALHGVFHAL